MNWPRGRYNHKRIVGFNVEFTLNVRRWRLWGPHYTSGMIMWMCGPFRIRIEAEYDCFD